MAEELRQGHIDVCPVCGSREFPQLAIIIDEVPTQDEVDAKEAEVNAERARLDKARETYNRAKTNYENKIEDINSTWAELSGEDSEFTIEAMEELEGTIRQHLSELNELMEADNNRLERRNKLTKNLPVMENKLNSIKADNSNLEKEIASLEATITSNQKILNEKKAKLTSIDKEQATAMVRELTSRANKLQSDYDAADSNFQALSKNKAAIEAVIKDNTDKLRGAEAIDIEAERKALSEASERKTKFTARYNIEQNRLSANTDIKANIESVAAAMSTREQKLRWVAALANTASGKLGQKDKVELETYVQGAYFDRIIGRANLRLLKMTNGQYELKRSAGAANQRSKSGLDLDVVDHYGGEPRSVKSLSGGEQFMASLSLALGLSDEIQALSGGVQIDTVFVDEGFGSLDSDTLEQAYNALAALTEGNRLVGIISHVSELKSRIDKQIVIKKERSGGSTAEIII